MGNASAFSWIISSIFFSTVLISLNKYVTRAFHFDYMSCLTSFHFIVTYLLLEVMCRLRFFERASHYPTSCRWRVASFGVASVVLMNFNLAKNSVGFYQLSKLCCIPATVGYNYFVHKTKTPMNIMISLTILLIGVGLYSINDIELNAFGSVIATLAVIATAAFQLGAGIDQKTYLISGPQIQHATAFPQFVLCFFTSIFTEVLNPQHSILQHKFSSKEVLMIILTALLAVGVNVSCFGIIGKTSALTYQVVGHVKTLLILLSGFLLFPPLKQVPTEMLVKTFCGMVISMIGIIMYSIYSMKNKPKEEVKEKDSIAVFQKENQTIEDVREKPLPNNLFENVYQEEKEKQSLT